MRRGELIVNLVFLGVPVIGIFLAMVIPLVALRIPELLFCLALYGTGICLLVAAKVSLFRQGIWVSFGPSGMSRIHRACYGIAYVLLVSGAVVNVALLFWT